MNNISGIPIFFVVGRPRSGTTLLRMLFDAHPDVTFPPECQFIVNLYPKYKNVNPWTEEDLISFYDDLCNQWLFDTWKMDKNKLKENLLEYAGNHSYGTICKVVYMTYNSLFDKKEIKLIGDKNPGYAIYTKLLLRIFPEAKFIHIVRDYRDNFVSIKNVDFELPIPSIVVQKWKYFFKKFRKDSKLNPARYYTINYENLATNPSTEFEALCQFAGASFDNSVFNFYSKKDELLDQYPEGYINTYHTSLMNKVNTSKIGVWKKALSNRQVMIMDQTAGIIANEAGYVRKYNGFNPLVALAILPGRVYAGILYLITKLVDTFPYRLRMLILMKGPLFLAKLYLSIFNRKKLKKLNAAIINE